jgi:hypothetical protein
MTVAREENLTEDAQYFRPPHTSQLAAAIGGS